MENKKLSFDKFSLSIKNNQMQYNNNQVSITVSIIWDGKYWTALFEKRELAGYCVAKATISVNEPQGYQIEKFLNNLDRSKLQFTPFGAEPITTKLVLVEKKQKFEKAHLEEVQLKNIHGDAKSLLYKQKNQNRINRKENENAIAKQNNDIKQAIIAEKQIQKRKGR